MVSRPFVASILAVALLAGPVLAGNGPNRGVVLAYPKACRHGVHEQTGRGPFAVLLFCDDAAGSHLAVVCYKPGCGNAQGEPWSLSDRLWQSAPWAEDVTGFAWDKNARCLYVSTSGIYGTGDLYALNLRARQYFAVPLHFEGTRPSNDTYTTTIRSLNTRANVLTYDLEYFDAGRGKPAREAKTLALPACGE